MSAHTNATILKEKILNEYKKCLADPVYFMRKYCYIQHPVKGKMLFNLYDFQERTLNDLHKHDYNIILKSRQLGISTLVAGYSLWLILFHNDKNILVLATKQDVAKNLVLKVKTMYAYLPTWLKRKAVEDNKLSLRLDNGSQIKATTSTADSGRSEALSLLVIDEAAFVGNVDKIWVSSQQTLATGGKAILLSTPNGIGDFFHKTWSDAELGLNNFNTIKLDWTVHPDRDKKWRQEQDELLGQKGAAQECLDGDCVVTIQNVISNEIKATTLQELYTNCKIFGNYNDIYKILTPSGFQYFDNIKQVTKDKYIQLYFNNNTELKCSYEHLFYIKTYYNKIEPIEAKNISADVILHTTDELNYNTIITKKEKHNIPIKLYDIINVKGGNIFIINDNIITHNCDASFNSSGQTVIDVNILQYYIDTIVKDPIEKRYINDDLWIFESVDPSKTYIISADVARGDGKDYSAFHILELNDLIQVGEYKGHISTTDYAHLLVSVAREYNNAILVIENASIGWAVIQSIIELEYQNLYYSTKDTAINTNLYNNTYSDKLAGFTTSSKTRPLLIAKMEEYLRNKYVTINSKRLLNELYVFTWQGSRAEALQGYNDDLVMSFAIGLYVRDIIIKLITTGVDLQKNIIDNIQVIKPAGAVVQNNIHTQYNPSYDWSMHIGNRETEDLKWLI